VPQDKPLDMLQMIGFRISERATMAAIFRQLLELAKPLPCLDSSQPNIVAELPPPGQSSFQNVGIAVFTWLRADGEENSAHVASLPLSEDYMYRAH
jgi:hypothetical protein